MGIGWETIKETTLRGAVQFEKTFNSLFESFSKNRLLNGLSGIQKLQEFKVMVKAAQLEAFEAVCWKRFQHKLEINMLEMKMEASFEDGFEKAMILFIIQKKTLIFIVFIQDTFEKIRKS